MTVIGYGASDKKADLAPVRFERPAIRPGEVSFDVLYCGVCHSDVHQCHDDWGNTVWPCVPGHEIVGRVTEVGDGVTRFAAGDLVGVGCMVNSCQTCDACQAGEEQYCTGPRGATLTYNGPTDPDGTNTYGGYSTALTVREEFCLTIPDAIDPTHAGPILCAGITTYHPLKYHDVGPGMEVAIAGIGGLGHMAIQIAKALGARVTALTTSPSKADPVKELGADDVLVMDDEDAVADAEGRFDLILSTIPYAHDVNPYVSMVAHDGTLHFVGLFMPVEELETMDILFKRKALMGSLIGGVAQTQEVLEFCAEHDIRPEIEIISIAQVNDAFQRVKDEDVRFRHVIDMATLHEVAGTIEAEAIDPPVRGLPEDGGDAPAA